MRGPSIEPKSLAIGLLGGLCLALGVRAVAQQPPAAPPAAPPPPAAAAQPPVRFQIAAAGHDRVFALDHQTNVVYLFGTSPEGVWEAGPGFSIPDEIGAMKKQNPIRRSQPPAPPAEGQAK